MSGISLAHDPAEISSVSAQNPRDVILRPATLQPSPQKILQAEGSMTASARQSVVTQQHFPPMRDHPPANGLFAR
jgi:hypothetical protein